MTPAGSLIPVTMVASGLYSLWTPLQHRDEPGDLPRPAEPGWRRPVSASVIERAGGRPHPAPPRDTSRSSAACSPRPAAAGTSRMTRTLPPSRSSMGPTWCRSIVVSPGSRASGTVCRQPRAHNPEGVGSNPTPAMSVGTTLEPSAWRAFAFSKASATASDTVAVNSTRLLGSPAECLCERPGEEFPIIQLSVCAHERLDRQVSAPLSTNLHTALLGGGSGPVCAPR